MVLFTMREGIQLEGKCPACGSTDVNVGVPAGGGPDGHWEEDVCNKCGEHFNCKAVYTE